MVRDTGDVSVHLLQIKEVVTQWDPIAMISYGIGVLPLIRKLRGSHTRVTQPWYADDLIVEKSVSNQYLQILTGDKNDMKYYQRQVVS